MNTAIFSLIDAVLIRPIDYPDPGRLVWITQYDPSVSHVEVWGSRADFLIWKHQANSFDAMAAYGDQELALATSNGVRTEGVVSVGGDFWKITGARPS
ncbi:MAG: hypothetical protein ACRD3Y_03690, partial [Bryobacteraceae bacterium]